MGIINKIVEQTLNGLREMMFGDRELMTRYALSYTGTWYTWGGDNPMEGFDCSGYTGEVGRAFDVFPRGSDLTAHQQWEFLKDREVQKPYKGCWVFWFDSQGKATHVEYCISEKYSSGSSGGGSKTLTKDDAIKHNAFIKTRPINSRAGIKRFADPFLTQGGTHD
jgi:hypothetical protein